MKVQHVILLWCVFCIVIMVLACQPFETKLLPDRHNEKILSPGRKPQRIYPFSHYRNPVIY